MSTKDTGGPAFPQQDDATGWEGMTLRDYFIAHAPAEPQEWFEPVMPTRPAPVEVLQNLTQNERDQLEGWGDYYSTSEITEPRIKAYCEARDQYNAEQKAWNRLELRERYIQWPAAWADAMIEQRKKGGES